LPAISRRWEHFEYCRPRAELTARLDQELWQKLFNRPEHEQGQEPETPGLIRVTDMVLPQSETVRSPDSFILPQPKPKIRLTRPGAISTPSAKPAPAKSHIPPLSTPRLQPQRITAAHQLRQPQ
jgi:hypothetical protein